MELLISASLALSSFFCIKGGGGLWPPDMASAGRTCEPKWLYVWLIPISSKAAFHLIGLVKAFVKMSAAIASVLQ